MTTQEFIANSTNYNNKLDIASAALKSITEGNRNHCGLVSDEVKNSDAYKVAKKNFNIAFANLRNFNKSASNKIKKEASRIRRAEKWGV